jgi:hypothetical protein
MFGFPVANFVRYKPSLILKLTVFRLSHAHVHGGACLKNEKVVTSAWVVKKRALFSPHTYILRSHHTSNHGVSPWATRIAACSSRSPLSRTREKIFTPAVQGIKNAHLQQVNASVCGRKNILGSSLMMAHDGHMRQTAYRYVRHGAQFHEHPNTP